MPSTPKSNRAARRAAAAKKTKRELVTLAEARAEERAAADGTDVIVVAETNFEEFETPDGDEVFIDPDAIAAITSGPLHEVSPTVKEETALLYLHGISSTIRVLGNAREMALWLSDPGHDPAAGGETFRSEAARISPPESSE